MAGRSVVTQLSSQIAQLSSQIETVASRLEAKLDSVDRRFDSIDRHFRLIWSFLFTLLAMLVALPRRFAPDFRSGARAPRRPRSADGRGRRIRLLSVRSSGIGTCRRGIADTALEPGHGKLGVSPAARAMPV